MERIDLKVGFACNNMCKFCVQGDKRFHVKPRKKEDILEKLDIWYKEWKRWVTFTGGEPTVHPNLLEWVKYATKLGYKNIQIQSNGRNFADMEYCKELIDAWVTEFGPSIHGFREATHDDLVWVKWAWKEVVQWLKNLKKLNQLVIINSVITKSNYKELPKLALLLASLWVKQFQFAFVHILGSAETNAEEIVARKSDVMPYVYKWLDIGKKNWMVCMTEAIPFCLMQWYEWAIAEYNFMPETKVFDGDLTIESYTDYRWNQWKAKWKPCENCKMKDKCEWPWKEYIEIYGWDEFKTIL